MNPNNVSNIADRAPQSQCRFTIQATLRGFPIVIEGEGRAGDLKIIVDRLFDLGAEPPTAQAVQPAKQNGAPSCPEHGTAKPSKRPGSLYCPTALPDGGYCRWTGKA